MRGRICLEGEEEKSGGGRKKTEEIWLRQGGMRLRLSSQQQDVTHKNDKPEILSRVWRLQGGLSRFDPINLVPQLCLRLEDRGLRLGPCET